MRLLILFLFLPFMLFAQTPAKSKLTPLAGHWYLGASVGPDFYYGDLNDGQFIPKKGISLAGSLFTHYHFSNIFGLKIQLLVGGVNGSKTVMKDTVATDNAFTGLFIDLNVNATINFSNLFSPNKPSRKLFIYGTAGLGYSVWFSKLLNVVYSADSIQLNTFVNSAVVIPLGIGALYSINKKLQVSAEWTFRTFLSDKLDNTIGGYRFDMVDYLSIGISYNLGGKATKKQPSVQDYPYQRIPVFISTPPPVRLEPKPQPQPPKVTPVPAQPDEYLYKVQICAFDQHNYSAGWIRTHYRVNQLVTREQEGAMSRYTVGGFSDMQKAKELRDEMIRLGIHDVFIIAYKDGVRHHTVIIE